MESRIWLVGGTTESIDLAHELMVCQLPCIITVTSQAAQGCYPQDPGIQVHAGVLNADTLKSFIHDQRVGGILDASHPYATKVSTLAMAAAHQFQLPYLRFERLQTASKGDRQALILEVETLSHLLCDDYLGQQRVLLTIGRQSLHLFKDWQHKCTLFTRILPYPEALQAALNAGFSCDRILALRPPISFELEKALWQHWHISLVVSKASGQPGGEQIKRQVAEALGVKLAIIQRPPMDYPRQTSDLPTAIQFCQAILHRQQI